MVEAQRMPKVSRGGGRDVNIKTGKGDEGLAER